MIGCYVYGVGMLVGALLLVGTVFNELRQDPAPGAPWVELLILIACFPVGAAGGAVCVGLLHALLRLCSPPAVATALRLPLTRCPACGRSATNHERARSGLCAVCRAPLAAAP